MTTRTHPSRLLAAVVVLGILSLTGCATGEPQAERSSAPASPTAVPEPTTATATAPATNTATAPATDMASATATATAAAPVCTAGMLSTVLETEMGGGAAGSVYRQIIFTNAADVECSINGYPGLSYVDAAGEQVGAPAEREPGDSVDVLLGPGESAVAPVKQTYAEHYGAGCELVGTAGLRVYPPNATDFLIVDQTGSACASEEIVLMTVAPVKPLAP